MAATNKDWTREEHILAFNLYCKIPFGRQHSRTPEVIELAKLLGRTAGSVALKLNNFSRLDPELQARGIKGMSHGAKGEIEVWRVFEDDPAALAYESEKLLASLSHRTVEDVADIDEANLPTEGRERERLVRVRVNQHFFRKAALAAYDHRCCVSGLAIPDLLVASHIISWANDSRHRMNPRNGLCLNALHDRAFDRYLMFLDEKFRIRFTKGMETKRSDARTDWLTSFEGKPIEAPKKFQPTAEFVAAHRERCFATGKESRKLS